MKIDSIYKIVVRDASNLDSYVDPAIFWEFDKAKAFAQELYNSGEWDGITIGDVVVCKEVPDSELGKFRTVEMTFMSE